jgi:hypothetical protein
MIGSLKDENDALRAKLERHRSALRRIEAYADGLHFAGRLKDERVVRAALVAARDELALAEVDALRTNPVPNGSKLAPAWRCPCGEDCEIVDYPTGVRSCGNVTP